MIAFSVIVRTLFSWRGLEVGCLLRVTIYWRFCMFLHPLNVNSLHMFLELESEGFDHFSILFVGINMIELE